MKGALYLISTPIGNLGDMTYRSVELLKTVDFIAAEDTRVSIKLLNHFNIKKPLVSYYEHNRKFSGEKIVSRLLEGESCALITDAGTPAISDPGEDIVRQCAQAEIPVFPIPGPCAAIAALSASGQATQRFCFEGFLSTARKSRFTHLQAIKEEERTLIFYEAPHKLLRTLQDFYDVLGDREISICRELTKLHEEILRTTLSEAILHFTEKVPRGEFVLVLHGYEKKEEKPSIDEVMQQIEIYRSQGHSLKQAAKLLEAETGYSKNELYARAISEQASK